MIDAKKMEEKIEWVKEHWDEFEPEDQSSLQNLAYCAGYKDLENLSLKKAES